MQANSNTKRTLLNRISWRGIGVLLLVGLLGSVAALLPLTRSEAATNSTLNFQARLQNASGGIVADGYYNIEFKLYNVDSNGTALWTESRIDTNGAAAGNDFRVRVKNGYISVNLGSLTAFPNTINWDQDLWLTMNVGGVAQTASPTWDGEMNPRLKVTSVPYAFRAGQLAVNSGSNTSTLSLAAPTGGNQNFVIPDQGAAGTYNLLTQSAANGSYIQNTTSQQTANFNISGNGVAGGYIDAAGGFRVNGASGATTTCSGGQFLQNATTVGGIVTGGSCATPAAAGVTTVGTLDSQTKSADGAVITGTSIVLQTADGSNPGLVSTGAQTFAGDKTFNNNVSVSGTINTNTFTGNTLTFGSATAASIQSGAGQSLSVDSGTTGALNIGTSANAKTIIVGNSTGATSVAINSGTGGINLGTNGVNKTIGIGATGSTANTTTVNMATSTGAAQTVNIGGTGASGGSNASSAVNLQGGATALKLANAGATIQTYTNSATALQVLNSSGAAVFAVDTTTANLVSNPGFEVNTTGWAAAAGAAIARQTTKANTYLGVASLQVTSLSGTANTGASVSTFTTSLVPGTYTLSFYAKASGSNFSTLNVTVTGGGAPSCITGAAVVTNGFKRFSCTFTSTSTNVTAISFLVSETTQRVFFLDSVQLTSGSSASPYSVGSIQLRGVVSTPATFQSGSDSTTAFQIQNSAGTSNLFVADTLNGNIGIGTGTPGYKLDVAGGDINIASGQAYRVGGVAGASTTCTGGQFLQNATVTGGIVTAASCGTATSGVTTVGTFSNTSIANGASISGNTITFGAADATNPGMVSTGTQTFSGIKTFSGPANSSIVNVTDGTATGSIFVNNASGNAGVQIGSTSNHNLGFFTANGSPSLILTTGGNLNVVGGGLQTNGTTRIDNSGNFNGGSVTSSSTVQGATVNATTGFQINGVAGAAVSCSGGQFLQNATVAGGIVTGGACATPVDTGVTTVGTFSGTTSYANGASISGNTITFGAADTSNPGLVSIGTQTFGGNKTISSLPNSFPLRLTDGTVTIGAYINNASGVAGGKAQFGTISNTDLAFITNNSSAQLILTTTGNLNLVSGAYQTNGTTRIDTSGNFTGNGANITALNAGNISTGTLGIARGGTGSTSYTTNGVVYSNGSALVSTAAGATGQCLKGNTSAAPTWGACGTASTMQDTYDNSTSPQIQLNSTKGAVVYRDASTTIGNLFQLQNSAGTATYFSVSSSAVNLQNTSGNSVFSLNMSTGHLLVYNPANSANYADVYWDGTAGQAVFAASAGNTTRVGNGSGNISLQLTNAADLLVGTKTATLSSGYSSNDFSFTRNISAGANSLTGSVVKVESTSTGTGTVGSNLLWINENNNSATGNLILATKGGAGNNKFVVDTNGNTTAAGTITGAAGFVAAAGQAYTGAGAVTLSSGASSALTLSGATGVTVNTGTGNLQIGSATTDSTANLLVLDSYNQATDPTGVNGAMYYNTNLGKFRCYEGGAWKNCVGVLNAVTMLSSLTSSSGAIANTETQVLSASIPANSIAVGDSFRISAFYKRSGTSSTSPTFRVRYTPTSLSGSCVPIAISPTVTTTAAGGSINGVLTFRVLGNGNAQASGGADSNYGNNGFSDSSAGSPNCNTTVAGIMEITALSGTSSNSYTFNTATIEKLSNQ